MEINYNGNKSLRLVNIYERFNKGEILNKEKLAAEYSVSPKTIQRDIDDLRCYFAEAHFNELGTYIKYSRANRGYYLSRNERECFNNEEVTAIAKILLESRAFNENEILKIIDKLLLQTSRSDREIVNDIIRNEYHSYIPPTHNKPLLSLIWELTKRINERRVIEFYYTRQDKKTDKKIVKPVAIMFSEFYFYLIAFNYGGNIDYPIVYRLDRIFELKCTELNFTIPYAKKFNDGEFRKRVQFMYSGPLKRVTFRYRGVVEAILDRLPTAEIIKKEKGSVIIKAEAYGNGINMWLNSQGDLVEIIENR